MRAGRLNRRVLVQKPTEVQDTHGGVAQTWSTHATLWASVEYGAGTEPAERAGYRAAQPATLRTRYVKGVRSNMRALVPKESTTLNGALLAGATTIVVTSADGFPVAPESGENVSYRIRIEDEVILITAGHGTTSWTATRGQDGTTAAAHADGTAVQLLEVHEIVGVANVDERNRELDLMTVVRGDSV